MSTIELARRVYAMRKAQKRYFRERTIELLDESKRQERELDKMVKEILDDKPTMLPGLIDDGQRAFEAGGQEWAAWNAKALDFGDDE